jgi:hypothetical protein
MVCGEAWEFIVPRYLLAVQEVLLPLHLLLTASTQVSAGGAGGAATASAAICQELLGGHSCIAAAVAWSLCSQLHSCSTAHYCCLDNSTVQCTCAVKAAGRLPAVKSGCGCDTLHHLLQLYCVVFTVKCH